MSSSEWAFDLSADVAEVHRSRRYTRVAAGVTGTLVVLFGIGFVLSQSGTSGLVVGASVVAFGGLVGTIAVRPKTEPLLQSVRITPMGLGLSWDDGVDEVLAWNLPDFGVMLERLVAGAGIWNLKGRFRLITRDRRVGVVSEEIAGTIVRVAHDNLLSVETRTETVRAGRSSRVMLRTRVGNFGDGAT